MTHWFLYAIITLKSVVKSGNGLLITNILRTGEVKNNFYSNNFSKETL